MLGEATDDFQFSLFLRVNINTGYIYICTYLVLSAVYRITLFLRTISLMCIGVHCRQNAFLVNVLLTELSTTLSFAQFA